MGLPSIPVPSAPALEYSDLQSKYDDFAFPRAEILLNKKVLKAVSGVNFIINDIHVETTSGFEASVASFRIYNVYDMKSGKFRYDEMNSQLYMGASVSISLGYLDALENVFVGFVAGIAFGYSPDDLPYIEVSAMDVKSLMMGGTYSYQLTSTSYGDAVNEVFKRTGYTKLQAMGGITGLNICDTPDKKPGADAKPKIGAVPAAPKAAALDQKKSAETIEMVAESDYEFVVKAAKKFNYEFFVDRGTVNFRKAKSVTASLASLAVSKGILGFHLEYSLTGIVGEVEARGMNAGEGKVIKSTKTLKNALSASGKAEGLVGQAKKVYIDPSINSKEQADARADSLLEQMSYRLGSLEADCVGIPDLVPGRFISVSGFGAPIDNTFYLKTVKHDFTSDGGYHTKIIACASKIKASGLSGGKEALDSLL